MTISLHVDVKRNPQLQAKLRELAFKVGDLRPVLGDIGASLEASTQQRFLDQAGPDGTPWEEHSEATIAQRGAGADILRQDEHLLDSLGHAVSGSSAAVGVNRIYGRIQHLGGEAGRNHSVTIPARPYLGISEADEREIVDIVSDHLGADS